MQVIRLVLLQAALAAGQLSDHGIDGTPSMNNALRATAEGEKPAVAMPSNLHTDYSSSNVVSNSPAPTATVSLDALAETSIPNNPPDQEADLPVGSTGVDDEEIEGGTPQALVSDEPVPAPVLSETAPPDTPVQTLEQGASPPTEIPGAITSNSPGNPIGTTPIIALNQPASSANFPPVSNENPAQTPVVTSSPAETTEAAILAVPDPSSQVPELPPPSALTPDPNFSSPIVSRPVTTVTEAAVPEAAAATTFLSVITSPSSSDSAFIALATDSSFSSVTSPSQTSSPDPLLSLSSISSTTTTTTQPAMTSSNTFNTSATNDTSNNTSLDASEDTSLQPATTAYPAHSSSNEYLSSQAKVAIVLVSVVGMLAVMAVIGYVLWHMRLRDQRLERGRRAAAAAAAAAAANREFDAGAGSRGSIIAGKEARFGGGGGSGGAVKRDDMGGEVEEEGGPRQEHEREGSGPKRTLIRFENKTDQPMKQVQGVPLGVDGKNHSDEAPGGPAVAVNRSSSLSGRSESSEGSKISTASRKEIAVGYGLDRSESQESEESHYSEGSGNEFRKMETLDGQRARYVHERSDSLRSQWSDVQDYYGIERLETEVPAGQETEIGAGVGAVAGVEALQSEETLVRTESNASIASGKSGQSIGKAL